MKVGDRILAVNEFSIVTLNLSEMTMLLAQCNEETSFTVEYDVSVIGTYVCLLYYSHVIFGVHTS